jgi:hypothetical protein
MAKNPTKESDKTENENSFHTENESHIFYIIHKDTRELIGQSNFPFNIDEQIQPPLPLIQLKHFADAEIPDYNVATEKLNWVFIDDDINFTRTYFYEVVAKTAQEQADYQTQQTAITERASAKAQIPNIASGSNESPVQRIGRLEQIVARVAKDVLP